MCITTVAILTTICMASCLCAWIKQDLPGHLIYHIAQKFDGEKLWRMGPWQNFGEQNFDELIVGFIGETLREKG